jgi:hypothetical protein
MQSEHWNDANGNPAGGSTSGVGFAISWQNGPLGRDAERIPPNGAFVEEITKAAIDRLEYYQNSRFACKENLAAIIHLQRALNEMNARTASREKRQVEGTHAE